jgi:hypothetical protein
MLLDQLPRGTSCRSCLKASLRQGYPVSLWISRARHGLQIASLLPLRRLCYHYLVNTPSKKIYLENLTRTYTKLYVKPAM